MYERNFHIVHYVHLHFTLADLFFYNLNMYQKILTGKKPKPPPTLTKPTGALR